MNADLAAAVGMSPAEYAALSNKERKEVMVREGDMDAMMAAVMKQAEVAQQQIAAQQSAQQQAMPATVGQQGMPPGMSPEMIAAIAQAQQAMTDAGMAMPDIPGMPVTGSSNLPAMTETGAADVPASSGESVVGDPAKPAGADTKLLPLDANMRGFVEFEHPEGHSLTLIIFNRQSEKELFRKDYRDGSIYEYIDFSRFQLPPKQIGVKYLDADGQILGELTPAVTG